MADTRIGSADLLLVRNSEEIIGIIMEHHKRVPEWGHFPAGPIKKTYYKTLVRTALPSVGFRAINTGRERKKSTYDSRTVECKFLDASWDIDVNASKSWEWGRAAAQEAERRAHILAAMKAVADQIWYGTSADASGFAGLSSIKDDSDDDQVVDAQGNTGSGCYSCWGIRYSDLNDEGAPTSDGVHLCWGNDASLEIGEIEAVKTYDSTNSGYFYADSQQIDGYVGLQIVSYEAFGRICNLDSSHPLTDVFIADLLSKFRVGEKPDELWMNRDGLNALRDSRTATNDTGKPAPFPADSFGVPIVVTDSLLSTESPLTAAAT